MIFALIPIPLQLLQAANDKAIEGGSLTFGHGIVAGLLFFSITLFVIGAASWAVERAKKVKPARK